MSGDRREFPIRTERVYDVDNGPHHPQRVNLRTVGCALVVVELLGDSGEVKAQLSVRCLRRILELVERHEVEADGVPPGPCTALSPAIVHNSPRMACTLRAGHAGAHEALAPIPGVPPLAWSP